ncbi:MAG: YceI family protein [Anaerolineales bacterium]|nr:YceI family protein [Anaerolineales bacterium]
MKMNIRIAVPLVLIVSLGLSACGSGASEQVGDPMSATPVMIETAAPVVPTQDSLPAGPSEPTQAAPETTDNASTAGIAGLSGIVVYQIVQAESQARFSIDEVLRGKPFTAVGVTNQVAGEIALNFDNKIAQVGVVQVDASTLKTDNNMRDRQIHGKILETNQYQLITFEPTAITGLPQSAELGETVSFQITGRLTIREITQEVTFDARATLVSPDRLEGYASVIVLRSVYQLVIPNVPQVADVAEEVLLEIDFVALRK